jgi:uncharacterized glyoxalase superfamily protein PhnB
MKLYVYLNYGGNGQEAFRFYEQHLGGKITMLMTHGQGPNSNNGPHEHRRNGAPWSGHPEVSAHA